jgi:exopolyphosphatase / guanosine-5'-triphosphate,3'-diphosphate pyrophosphatase
MGEEFAPSSQLDGRGKSATKRGRKKSKTAPTAKTQDTSRKGNDARANSSTVNPQPQTANAQPKADTRNAWLGKTAYAALDLGTNNCRLLIARAANDGFTVVDAFSRVVRLGEGLNSTGKMSEAAMDRAIEALSVCADKLKRRNVVLARSVATEACRQALNGVEFIERVKRETGIVLDVISPKEEARLAVMGCHALLEEGEGPAMIFDIGGGSTELVLVSTDGVVPEILDWASVPWGVVSLTESEAHRGDDEQSLQETYAAMREKVRDSFAEFAGRLPVGQGDHRLMGTSGTVTTLASVYLNLPSYDRRQIDGLHLPTSAMREISQTLASRPPKGRAEFPTIGHERADLVVAGCAILEAIFDIWPGERLGVADRGIREGILRALMASDAGRRKRR